MLKGICVGTLIGSILTVVGLSLYGYFWGLPYDIYCYGYFPAKETVDQEIEEYIAQLEANREEDKTTKNNVPTPSNDSTLPQATPPTENQVIAPSIIPEPQNMNHWVFIINTSSFDKKQTKKCILDADTMIQDIFDTVRPELTIIQVNNRAIDIRLTIKNKVLGHPQDRNRVRLKFDNEDPITVSFVGTADSSMDTIFLNSTSKVISKLKTAETLIIEVPFFMEGTRRITFNVSGYSEKCKF